MLLVFQIEGMWKEIANGRFQHYLVWRDDDHRHGGVLSEFRQALSAPAAW
jgi:hypothetical protein